MTNYTVSYLNRRYGIDIRAKIRPDESGRPAFHVSGLVDRDGHPLPDSRGRSVQETFAPIVAECIRRESSWTPVK